MSCDQEAQAPHLQHLASNSHQRTKLTAEDLDVGCQIKPHTLKVFSLLDSRVSAPNLQNCLDEGASSTMGSHLVPELHLSRKATTQKEALDCQAAFLSWLEELGPRRLITDPGASSNCRCPYKSFCDSVVLGRPCRGALPQVWNRRHDEAGLFLREPRPSRCSWITFGRGPLCTYCGPRRVQ